VYKENGLIHTLQASNAVDAGASAIVMMRDESTASSGPPTSRIFG